MKTKQPELGLIPIEINIWRAPKVRV